MKAKSILFEWPEGAGISRPSPLLSSKNSQSINHFLLKIPSLEMNPKFEYFTDKRDDGKFFDSITSPLPLFSFPSKTFTFKIAINLFNSLTFIFILNRSLADALFSL